MGQVSSYSKKICGCNQSEEKKLEEAILIEKEIIQTKMKERKCCCKGDSVLPSLESDAIKKAVEPENIKKNLASAGDSIKKDINKLSTQVTPEKIQKGAKDLGKQIDTKLTETFGQDSKKKSFF